MYDATQQFREAIRSAGLTPPDTIEPGKFHRFPGEGKRNGNTAGWCKFFPDGAGGIYGDYSTGLSSDWQVTREAPYSRAEREAFKIRVAAEKAHALTKRLARQAEAEKKAAAIWSAAGPSCADHPYLARKCVRQAETLREIDASAAAKILGYSPKSGVEILAGRLLVAPVKIGDKLSTAELIDEAGRKSALSGGAKAGGYWAAQPLPDGNGEGLTVQYGEGVATTLSAKEANGHISIAALSAGNLEQVAQHFKDRYPAARHVILADLMKTTGEPAPLAIEAAQAIDGLLAIPDFGVDRPEGATDFNDLASRCGTEAVKRAVASASAPSAVMPLPIARTPVSGDSGGWPLPQSLSVKVESQPYPIDALPPTILAAVEEVAAFVKAPIPMVASSALAALSLAIQAHADVKRLEKLHGPVGLFLLTIADSGERKSTCDGFFTKAIDDYEKAQAEAAKPILKDYKAAIAAWEAQRDGIISAIKHTGRTAKLVSGKDIKTLRADLAEHQHDEPLPPRIPRLLYADATPEALAYGLAKQWPSGGVVSAEAGTVFGSHGMGKDSVMRNLALLNQLWDGKSLIIDRRTSESFTMRGARLTVALQVQEPTLREFFSRSGALARGTGFLARFLVAWPESTQGMRQIDPDAPDGPATWPHLAAFHRRMAAILERPVPIDDDGALIPPMLTPTLEAQLAWVEYHNVIESALLSGGELYDVRDVASKSADNVARLAALFHVFSSNNSNNSSSNIQNVEIESATRIAAWHLNESRRFFGELALPVELADASRMDTWLTNHCRREKTHFVGKNHTRQHGPIRDGKRVYAALNELAALDRVRIRKDGKRFTIQVNPVLLSEADQP